MTFEDMAQKAIIGSLETDVFYSNLNMPNRRCSLCRVDLVILSIEKEKVNRSGWRYKYTIVKCHDRL